ncbi:MAG: Crp/Fnr family transcriptional regulator [Methylotenera sp.]|uniref:Crp/Fnr family transcriptional regulator n=1 Tax=Methylotenera sp. TaxID=2051956 RepID=UPI00248A42CF|nr:Crp/Fnr family transcriptional regulator [Methylotenera sp.]MDI1310501.1 Crp/Fnr family transcriptional regulator [Methylotenera sp.]
MTALIKKETPHFDTSLTGNNLLDSLPPDELGFWKPFLKPVSLPIGHVICESGGRPKNMFFPTTAIVSFMYMNEDGKSSEVLTVGQEGVVGVSLFLSNRSMINQAVVETAGQGYMLDAGLIKLAFERNAMLKMLLKYSQEMITQLIQNSISQRHLSVQQQLSRRLLLGLDRTNSTQLALTHEKLANILGVRRESITQAAMKLQQCGAISYIRGHLTVLDRRILEKSCHI